MFNFLSIFSKKPDISVLGIDIGSSAIKIVQLKKKNGKAVLETYGALALGPYASTDIGRATNLPVEKIVVALKDILREAKTTTNFGGIAIPFSSSLMSIIEMPLLPEKELASMVPLEARKYIPVPIAEVNLDWTLVPKDQLKSDTEPDQEAEKLDPNAPKKNIIQKTDVLIVAIHNDTIREYQDIIKQAALEANFFEIEIFSTMRAVLDEGTAPVMILDMGAASTKLYIVERGIVRNSHTINRGSQDITTSLATSLNIPVTKAEVLKRSVGYSTLPQNKDAAGIISLTLDNIFAEAKRVIFNYQTKYMKSIQKVVLVGGGVAMKGFAELATKTLETPVVVGDPFNKVEAPAFLAPVLKTNGPEFAVALGIALRRLSENQ